MFTVTVVPCLLQICDSGLKQLPFNGLCTSVMCRSVPQMPEYATRITTSLLFGSEGSGALMRESSLFLESNCTASIVGSVNKKFRDIICLSSIL